MQRITLILAVVLILILRPVYTALAGEDWFNEHERGWFWYNEKPEEELVKPPKPEPLPPVVVPQPPQPQGPPPLSAEWIRKNLHKYLINAIDNPTRENVAAYLYLQRVMLDKAQRYAEKVRDVVQMDPYLDEGTRRPIAEYGGVEYAKEVRGARRWLLAQIAQKAGIFFFFQGGCGHCEIQAPVLKSLVDRYGFVIFPISVNGEPLKSNLFPNYATDRGQARYLHVIQTPAMFLGRPQTRAIIPLGQSALSRDQLEDRILLAAKDAGWITPEEYNDTRGFNAELALNLRPGEVPRGLSEEKLINYIKRLYEKRMGAEGVGEGGETSALSETNAKERCSECGLK